MKVNNELSILTISDKEDVHIFIRLNFLQHDLEDRLQKIKNNLIKLMYILQVFYVKGWTYYHRA